MEPAVGAGVDTSSAVLVGSGPTVTVAVPDEPPTVDVLSGEKTAVRCSGDDVAANEAPQVAAGLDGEIATAVHPAIGTKPFRNPIVPDGDPEDALTTAISVTAWFVETDDEGDTISVVLLEFATSVSDCWALMPAAESDAVMFDDPDVNELLIEAL